MLIPFARPDVGEGEIQEVVDTLRSGWLTTGPKTKRFETEFAQRVGTRYALAVSSCTAAMHLALEAFGVGPGDRVLTTDYTFTATAEVIRYLGADPVFVDIDPVALNLSVEGAREYLERDPDVRVVMPVHFAGLACDAEALEGLRRDFDVRILEDAAHAFPATSRGRTVGSIGDATAFSFYATKTLAMGEGGILTTDDPDVAERAKVMRLHGISRDVFDRYSSEKPSWYYEVVAPGFKYNLTDIAAAIGWHQLKRAEALRARREEIASRYLHAFSDLPLRRPAKPRPGDVHAWHLFVIQLELDRLSFGRDELIERLAERGIGTSVHFIPLHRHPYWRDRYGLTAERFPQAEAVFQRVVSLPLYSKMTDEEVERVIETVRTVLLEGSR